MFGDRVDLHGCGFHWGQAVNRKIQELGLYTDFAKNVDAKKLLEKVLALQFIPAEHIRMVLLDLATKSECDRYRQLINYIEVQWCQRWCPEDWTQFYRVVRTNNEVEGWHYKMNVR